MFLEKNVLEVLIRKEMHPGLDNNDSSENKETSF